MRACLSIAALMTAVTLVASSSSSAQTSNALPGCEAAPAVRKIIEVKLDDDLLDKMKYTDRVTYERKTLEDLMAQYPRELDPLSRYQSFMSQSDPDEYPAMRARWGKAAQDHPDDPLALLIAGKALTDKNTPEAIRFMDAAKAKAPSFPWPDLYLASIYSTGKRADAAKMKEDLEGFFTACPGSTNSTAQWLLNKDQPFQPKVASAMRVNLAKETDPKRLQAYSTLWGLEFRTHPPNQHDAVRAQVAEDLKRLEALHPRGDAPWEDFLDGGYKESGASKETVTAKEDRMLHDFPRSDEAYELVSARWEKAHKTPEDQTDTAAWVAYQKEYLAALKGWLHDYPDTTSLQRFFLFYAVRNDDAVSDTDALAAMDNFVRSVRDYENPSYASSYLPIAADFLIRRKLQPARAIEFTQQAKAAYEKREASHKDDDNVSDENLKAMQDEQAEEMQYFDGLMLRASIEAKQPEPAAAVKAEVEAPVPTDKKMLGGYWLNRARFEVVEGHPQDALAYYQLALATRTETPKAYRGKVTDDAVDEARALWKQQGGSEIAYAVWSKPSGASVEQTKNGEWEKATKQIPDFALSDMNGKTWKLKDLSGKTVLINLWATWCGPCQAELPHLEKLYEKTKDRKDIQILTFDIDEDLGLLAPYLKEKGFTFPVLPAYSTVVGLLDGFAIPQTWLIDPQGVWESKQIGFSGGSDADFEKEMLDRVAAGKPGQ